jgi:hypothetical protein
MKYKSASAWVNDDGTIAIPESAVYIESHLGEKWEGTGITMAIQTKRYYTWLEPVKE